MVELECPLLIREAELSTTVDNTICAWPKSEDFIKTIECSPDSQMMVAVSDSGLINLLNASADHIGKMNPGESVYDIKWYPFLDSNDPATCCFITTCRDHPIQLWETSGILRASYIGRNHLDELDSAKCFSFNLTGDKIYAGSNQMIRVFDVTYPGAFCTDYPTSESRKSYGGQKGVISCLSFNPDYSGCYAAGSFNQSVGVYVENTRGSVLDITGLEFGVTHTKWSPCGNKLWIGGRKHSAVCCWDVRSLRNEVGRVTRCLQTNQRMTFDIDPWGKFLVTGSEDGRLLAFDISTFESVHDRSVATSCVNAVQFMPQRADVLVSCTGQRHFQSRPVSTSDGVDSTEEDEGEGEEAEKSLSARVWRLDERCANLVYSILAEEAVRTMRRTYRLFVVLSLESMDVTFSLSFVIQSIYERPPSERH